MADNTRLQDWAGGPNCLVAIMPAQENEMDQEKKIEGKGGATAPPARVSLKTQKIIKATILKYGAVLDRLADR